MTLEAAGQGSDCQGNYPVRRQGVSGRLLGVAVTYRTSEGGI